MDGGLCEEVRGLRMRDVSGGTLLPPANGSAPAGRTPWSGSGHRCRDLSVIELGAITGPCEKILSGPERERFSIHAGKARLTFLGARWP